MLVRNVCDVKQAYTQYGGLRPFGASLLVMGWDAHHGFQLYHTDPSGNYGGWKATCIGANSQAAQSILKQDYKEEVTLDDALLLAVKVLSKTMDTTTVSPDRLEFATLSRKGDKTVFKILDAAQVSSVLAKSELIRKSEEAAEKAKQDNVNVDAIVSGATGKTINPRTDILFKNVGYRDHSFSFKLLPRTRKEAEAIDNILNIFQYYSLPDYGQGSANFFIGYPYEFLITFFTQQADGSTHHLNTIGRSVLEILTEQFAGFITRIIDGSYGRIQIDFKPFTRRPVMEFIILIP